MQIIISALKCNTDNIMITKPGEQRRGLLSERENSQGNQK